MLLKFPPFAGNSNTSEVPSVVMAPLTKSLQTWQFSFPGPPSTPYARGFYTGRIHLPKNYPASPPSVYILTPSGRWRCREKICLSASDYHPETWDARWNIHRLLMGLQVHMASDLEGEIGSIQVRQEERRMGRAKRRPYTYIAQYLTNFCSSLCSSPTLLLTTLLSQQVSEVERRILAERSRAWRYDDGKGNTVDHRALLRKGVWGKLQEEYEKGGGERVVEGEEEIMVARKKTRSKRSSKRRIKMRSSGRATMVAKERETSLVRKVKMILAIFMASLVVMNWR